MSDATLKSFLDWFHKNGGSVDATSVGFKTFPESEGGRGAVALKDISEGHVLFTIPRSLTLSTRTSSLPSRFGVDAWQNMKLNQGWTGLILCMMWETAQGTSSKWAGYSDTLPIHFDTPMFWNEADLTELNGTCVVEKLGREEAEQSYTEKLLPAIRTRPDLFPLEQAEYYSLANYHLMGSRILSRSFNVEKWESEEEENENSKDSTNRRADGMDVDSSDGPERAEENGDEESHHIEVEEEDDEDDSSDTAMVPMADLLNAKYESENAKLFDDENELRMISTKPIKAGEQIWNTYGDLPNSELLRRYGHVDLLPLPNGGLGNPGDVIEIRADIAVSITVQQHPSLTSDSVQERVDWWLEEGGDDVFVLESDLELPEPLISLVRLLLLKQSEWETAKGKGKPPKPKVDADSLSIIHDVLQTRLKSYPTTLQEDEVKVSGAISTNTKNAIVVRMGEKRILNDTLIKIREIQAKGNSKKRKGAGVDSGAQKRSRK
ncbi:hypothetical protein DXG03_004081 [Asterophora parasitica]|uniref:Ribosomal lysine N-methyltransferase 4 n=1 Tax=Asterophora parasitica TaxID=117018 RepID=A0A9P7G9A3_9AGAR|nr:hypothetical protein DXG03_004081 [Asterophora parasitica]